MAARLGAARCRRVSDARHGGLAAILAKGLTARGTVNLNAGRLGQTDLHEVSACQGLAGEQHEELVLSC
jgi:hypothetical protein